MLERVFPSPTDFTYRGSKIALWLLGLILFLKLAIALGAIAEVLPLRAHRRLPATLDAREP